MKNPEEGPLRKRPYEKPELTVIELAADEVLVSGCKSVSGGFSMGQPPPCAAHSCAGPGS